MGFSFMDSQRYSRVHAILIVQPFNRVIVTKSQYGDFFWQASITRALVMEPAKKIIKAAIATLFKVDPKAFKFTTLEHTAIDEIDYTLLIAEMSAGYRLSIGNDKLAEFIPIKHVLVEVLDDAREYSTDSKRVLTYLSNSIKQDRIGNIALGRAN